MPARDPFYDDLLRRLQAGDILDFDALVREYPGQSGAIERVRAVHEFLRTQEPGTRASGSFAAKLRERYGDGDDPEVSLDGGRDDHDDAPSSELLRRLTQKGLKGSRYQLRGEVARGGMGAILRVWDEELRRSLAMKVILGRGEAPAASSTPQVEPGQLARFLEEAQVTGQLDHPGIVPVHELGLDAEGRVFFTMKLVKGRDLKAVFDLVFDEKDGWNETRALSVILRACEAMAYAHAKGVIHRDLKPANVMVGNFGEVYVMDWGLARVLGKEDAHDIRLAPDLASALSSVRTERRDEREQLSDSPLVTMDGDVVGTPAYMSPEQARGEIEKLGPRSDVYSVGAMLYHLLARQAPYVPRGVRITNRTALGLVLQGPPESLAKLRPDAPAELVAIVEKAMARDAGGRYSDTVALADDLRAFLEHRVVRAYETGAWAEAKKWVQRNKPLAASLAGAAALLVAGLTTSLVFKVRAEENARLAEQRFRETAALALIARENEKRAVEQELIAKANEARATENERLTTKKANDVLSLSSIQDLKELTARADKLWPAYPEMLPQYDEWLADARSLVEGQAADIGQKARPSLTQHEANLRDLRMRAKPRTPEQIEADRCASTQFLEWSKLQSEMTWMRRMLGTESWPTDAQIEAEMSETSWTETPELNNSVARGIMEFSDRGGAEVHARILAERALAASRPDQRPQFRITLAKALSLVGRFDEALSHGKLAIEEADENQQEVLQASLEEIREQATRWEGEAARAIRLHELSVLGQRAADMDQTEIERQTFDFEDPEDTWWHLQLSQLVSDLNAFRDESLGGLFSTGVSEMHGPGVVKRAEWARMTGERSVSGTNAKRIWSEAIAAIAHSSLYNGLRLDPQMGLLPIGTDPSSGLWEFWHVQSGERPERGSNGQLIVTEEMGIVLVLVPGGTFVLGAQSADDLATNFDPDAQGNEELYQIKLDAYFLSKYEMTIGQWEIVTGGNPSYFGPSNQDTSKPGNGENWSISHPVDSVSWVQCQRTLEWLGLTLPTEAQWEHGCRGSTDSVYWYGSQPDLLAEVGNVSSMAPVVVGSYSANDLGLHDTHGNVAEWCRDTWGTHQQFSNGDGLRFFDAHPHRAIRGGSYSGGAWSARSAARVSGGANAVYADTGLRPCRPISPTPASRDSDSK